MAKATTKPIMRPVIKTMAGRNSASTGFVGKTLGAAMISPHNPRLWIRLIRDEHRVLLRPLSCSHTAQGYDIQGRSTHDLPGVADCSH